MHVLVVEDQALVALSPADLLEAEGHEVDLAFDGEAALAAARQRGGGLAVLVTDLHMPGLRGEDPIRMFRAERPSLPVVVVTGPPPLGGVEELKRYGGGHGPMVLLHKLVDFEALLAALDRVAGPEAAVLPIGHGRVQGAAPTGLLAAG